jgi:N-methylhydantoinase B
MTASAHTRPTFDGVRLAVISNRFEGIVRSMANTLLRTGRSGVLNIGRDFSCCILTRDDELLAIAESQPVHVMTSNLMTKAMKEFHPEFRGGDAFLHNSPYHGNTHAADYTILIPVMDGEGTHHFTVLAKAHQADCGNASPTTYSAAARDVYEEGALIFPAVKVQENYEDCRDFIRMCELRVRVPEQWWGDYLALLGAARIGERRILELGAELGWDTLHEHTREWFDYSEQLMIAAIRKLPSGRVTTTNAHDPFPGVPEGIPIKVTVKVDSAAAMVEVDLRDNPDCQPCGLNLTEATSRGAGMMGIFNSIGPGVPPNAGSYRRLRVHLRENCVVGIPRHPASCSVATTNLADRVAHAVQRAMAELGEGVGMGENGYTQPPAWAVISGRDPRRGNAPFVNQLILPGMTCGAASPFTDGWLLLGGAGDAGMLFRDSVEYDEFRQPIRIHAQRIIPDTEGAGRFRGAPAAYVEYGPVDCSLELMWASDGTINPPRGARGGLRGAQARQYTRDGSGQIHELANCGRLVLAPGENVISISCSGSGYGPPMERDSERVRQDVLEGWITRQRARDVYGVVLDASGEVDAAATAARRAELAAGTRDTEEL